MTRFITAERQQMLLMPPSIADWIPEDHLASFVADIVDQVNLSQLADQYRGSGKKPYSPAILVGLLFYGYATGMFSSRKIEAATHDSVAFRFLAGNTHPDHDTIATFRRRFIKQLTPLFVQILSIAREMGCAKVGTVAIDGTKVHANASKHKALSWKHACRLEKQLRREVEELLKKAESADAADDEQLDIPAEVARREQRLARIAEAKRAIEQRAQQRHEEAQRLFEQRRQRRAQRQQQTGQKASGKKPQAPQPQGPQDGDQHNFTDSDSRIMKSHGGFEQCYNAQAAVDAEDMLIVGTSLSNCASDATAMKDTLESVERNTSDIPGSVLADAGYQAESNVEECEKRNIESYIAVGRDKHNQRLRQGKRQRPPPHWSSLRKMMWRRLHSAVGKEMYRWRKMTVEPVFGIIKYAMGFRRFMLRGLDNVKGEWDLVALAYDIRRLWSLQRV